MSGVRTALRETDPPGVSFPLADAALCLDDLVVFNGREDSACPKCGAEVGIATVRVSGVKQRDESENEKAPVGGTTEA